MGTAEVSDVDLSVLVPVRDEAPGIRAAVSAMRSQTFSRQLEFLYMDGRSQDGTRETLEELSRVDSRVRVLDNPHGGIPQALNIGLRHARGRFIARMDAHTLYPPDYLETGVRWLERGDADWVAGPQLAQGVDRWSRRIAHAFDSPLGIGAASFRRAGDTTAFETDTGFTGIWRVDTLKRLNGWDERWSINEDAELAARLREGGGRIVCVPEMAARWIPRRSLAGLVRQYWRYGQYREKTCLHHPESMRRSQLLPPALVLTALGAALPGRTGKACRLALSTYALVVTGESARLAKRGVPLRDAATLPSIFASMHLAWGTGFLTGCARFGVPASAIRLALGRLGRGAKRQRALGAGARNDAG
jgi:succinoglycan biosynthesis protein ExoA